MWIATAVLRRMSFICPMRSTLSATTDSGGAEDSGLLCSAQAARQNHHASLGGQSSGIPGRRTERPGGWGDEPLPRRRQPAVSRGKAARDDRRFRSAVRARRRPAVAISIACAAADLRWQRRPDFVVDRPATPESVTRVWHTAGDLTVRSSAPKPRAAARLIVSRPDSVKPS